MRRWAFIIFVVGMFVLILLLNSGFREVESYDELESLEINTRVYVSGEVESERILYGAERAFEIKGIEFVCTSCESLIGEKADVEGIVSEYNSKKQVRVLKVMR